jgi:hypothetical protein
MESRRGHPGRLRGQRNDDTSAWRWRWEKESPSGGFYYSPNPEKHPVRRAVRLARTSAAGSVCRYPLSRISKARLPTQAESFMISRPWFIWDVEKGEERIRFARVPEEYRPGSTNYSSDALSELIAKRWKQRGDWGKNWGLPNEKAGELAGNGRTRASPLNLKTSPRSIPWTWISLHPKLMHWKPFRHQHRLPPGIPIALAQLSEGYSGI